MSRAPGPVVHPQLIRALLWSVLVGLVLYGATVIIGDIEAFGSSMTRLSAPDWLLVLGLSLANYGMRYLRWDFYLRLMGHAIPLLRNLTYYLAGFAFTTTPGKAGEAVRSIYLKAQGVRYTESLAALFTERLVDLIAIIILALSAALAFEEQRLWILVLAALILAIILFIRAPTLHTHIERRLNRLPIEKFRHFVLHFFDLVRSASTLLRTKPLLAGVGMALVAWGAEGIGFHIILVALGVDTSLATSVGIYSISVLIGALSFIPGGLGSTEAVMVLLLKVMGADTPTAIAATVICRLATLWFAVLIGVVTVAMIEIRAKRSHAPPSNA